MFRLRAMAAVASLAAAFLVGSTSGSPVFARAVGRPLRPCSRMAGAGPYVRDADKSASDWSPGPIRFHGRTIAILTARCRQVVPRGGWIYVSAWLQPTPAYAALTPGERARAVRAATNEVESAVAQLHASYVDALAAARLPARRYQPFRSWSAILSTRLTTGDTASLLLTEDSWWRPHGWEYDVALSWMPDSRSAFRWACNDDKSLFCSARRTAVPFSYVLSYGKFAG